MNLLVAAAIAIAVCGYPHLQRIGNIAHTLQVCEGRVIDSTTGGSVVVDNYADGEVRAAICNGELLAVWDAFGTLRAGVLRGGWQVAQVPYSAGRIRTLSGCTLIGQFGDVTFAQTFTGQWSEPRQMRAVYLPRIGG